MTDTEASAKPSRAKSAKLFARDVIIIVLAAILISFLVKTFLVRSFYIPSPSMETTLDVGDRILVNELEPKFIAIQRGDVVVFRDPGGWLPTYDDTRNPLAKGIDTALGVIGLTAPDSNDHLIKRVIGLPGDHVTCCGTTGQVSVNGVPLDEPYIQVSDAAAAAAPNEFDITVPEGKLWVLGDNRYDSADSLNHYTLGDPGGGMVPIDNVVGRAFVTTWPLSRWSWLDNYPDVFAGTDG